MSGRLSSQPQPDARGLQAGRRRLVVGTAAWCLGAAVGFAHAQANPDASLVEVETLYLRREDGQVLLDFDLRVTVAAAVEEALRRGVPLYFVAQVQLLRARWYWRDERIARVERQWRLSYQPLTGIYRVSLGAIGQSHTRLEEALAAVSRLARWEITDAQRTTSADRHYAEFSWRLDTGQLPRPMQFGMGPAAADWALGVERVLRLEN